MKYLIHTLTVLLPLLLLLLLSLHYLHYLFLRVNDSMLDAPAANVTVVVPMVTPSVASVRVNVNISYVSCFLL